MSNIVSLRKRTHPLSGLSGQPAASRILDFAPDIDGRQSPSKQSIHTAIFMLDLALQLNREVVRTVGDPVARKNIDAHLSIIEELLASARERSLKL